MAGYTSRNFLSLTIPSIFGFLSILWFLRKRNSNSKEKESVEQGDEAPIQYPENTHIYYPMKLKDQEGASSNESAEMQLKEAETGSEKQFPFSNGVVPSNPKVNGKVENTSRLHENGNSCSVESPMNGWHKDNTAVDKDVTLSNGMKDLNLNGTNSVNTASFACAISKTCADFNISNGFPNLADNSVGLETGTVIKNGSVINLSSKVDSENSHPVDISSTAAKTQDLMNGHKEPICNGSAKDTDYSKSRSLSIQVISTCDKQPILAGGHRSDIFTIQLANDKMSHMDDLSYVDSVQADADEHRSQSGDSEHSELSLLSNPHDEIADEDMCTSSIDKVADGENVIADLDSISVGNPQETPLTEIVAESVFSSPVPLVTSTDSVASPLEVVTCNKHMSPPIDYMVTNSAELLTLPVDYVVADVQGEMLPSPGAKYCDSLGSNDSGRGASEIQFTLEAEPHLVYMVYEFEILPEDCGRLIGRCGRHVKYINKQTNANIVIKKHPCSNDKKLCAITGTENEINAALKLVRKRFPIEHFPSVTLAQINNIPISTLFSPETLKLTLPEGGVFEALLCSTVNAGHFFLQQPTHPTFHQLPPLTNAMNALYKQTETPVLENPTKGNICAAEIGGGWYRAEVDEVYEQSDECRLKFLDYGGYADVQKASIRKIKCDFMSIPFQATECLLAGVIPMDENGWSREATMAFEQLAQGQLIQGCIVAYSESRVPYLNLYKITGISSVFINQELVNSGMARGIPLIQ